MASIHPIRDHRAGCTPAKRRTKDCSCPIVAWRVHWREGREQKAKQRKSKKAADKIFADVVKNEGKLPTTTDETVAQFAHRWLTEYAEVKLAKSTVNRDYMPHLNQRIIPYLGNKPLANLSPAVRDRWVSDMAGKFAPNGKRVHSNNAINGAVKTASTMLGRAVKWGVLRENPFRDFDKLPTEPAEIVVPQLEEVDALVAVMPTPADAAVVTVAAFAGPRRSEIFALFWRDAAPPWLYIRRALDDDRSFKLPKNTQRRETVLLPNVVAALQLHHDQADGTAPDDLLFPSSSGTVMDPSNWHDRVWQPARETLASRCERWMIAEGASKAKARKAGDRWRRIQFHWMRHFFVSLCASRGVPELKAREWSGHTDDRMWRHYRHWFDRDVEGIVAAFSESIEQLRLPAAQ